MGKEFISIQELLYGRGLNKNAKIKLVRHADKRKVKIIGKKSYKESVSDLYWHHKPVFEIYQSEQHRSIFHGVDYIVSFIGDVKTTARFIGVYQINSIDSIDNTRSKFFYHMEKVKGFEEIEDKLIIEWGGGTRQWAQWIKGVKEVIRIE